MRERRNDVIVVLTRKHRVVGLYRLGTTFTVTRLAGFGFLGTVFCVATRRRGRKLGEARHFSPEQEKTLQRTIVEKTPSRSKPDIGSLRSTTVVTNQDEVRVMSFTSIVLMRRRPVSDSA